MNIKENLIKCAVILDNKYHGIFGKPAFQTHPDRIMFYRIIGILAKRYNTALQFRNATFGCSRSFIVKKFNPAI